LGCRISKTSTNRTSIAIYGITNPASNNSIIPIDRITLPATDDTSKVCTIDCVPKTTIDDGIVASGTVIGTTTDKAVHAAGDLGCCATRNLQIHRPLSTGIAARVTLHAQIRVVLEGLLVIHSDYKWLRICCTDEVRGWIGPTVPTQQPGVART
jgi:hypothetical protein